MREVQKAKQNNRFGADRVMLSTVMSPTSSGVIFEKQRTANQGRPCVEA